MSGYLTLIVVLLHHTRNYRKYAVIFIIGIIAISLLKTDFVNPHELEKNIFIKSSIVIHELYKVYILCMYMLGELDGEHVVVLENVVLARRRSSFSNATISLNKIMHTPKDTTEFMLVCLQLSCSRWFSKRSKFDSFQTLILRDIIY
jgi:hypothetical protein